MGEPYQSRFAELLPDLVDNLAQMLEAINQGLKRSLSPSEVFSVPTIQCTIEEHIRLRKREGIDAASVIREYQVLAIHLSQFLASLVEQGNITIHDYVQLNVQVQQYVDELIRIMVRNFTPDDRSDNNPS